MAGCRLAGPPSLGVGCFSGAVRPVGRRPLLLVGGLGGVRGLAGLWGGWFLRGGGSRLAGAEGGVTLNSMLLIRFFVFHAINWYSCINNGWH